jgi:outer membrane protein assembly factor BamB
VVSTRTRLAVAVGLAAFLATAALGPSGGLAATDRLNWPMYLYGPRHSSTNLRAAAITPASSRSLHKIWRWTAPAPTKPGQPDALLYATPVVFDGRVFVATFSGLLFVLDEHSGAVVWKRFVGFDDPVGTCLSRGFVATPAVAKDPVTHVPTVYVAAGDGYLYAYDAATGAFRWKSLVAPPSDGYYNWSSPSVLNGRIFVGVGASCLVDTIGGLKAFDQATGAVEGSYQTVPDGSNGGPVWSTTAADGGHVWVSTGDAEDAPSSALAGDSYSIVRLDAATLEREDAWRVPHLYPLDLDFGASPTLFDATIDATPMQLVGACNKNGIFYALSALDLSAGPVWKRRLGVSAAPGLNSCIAGAVWDSAAGRLFVAGNETIIGGEDEPGSIRELDPSDGSIIWQRGLHVGPVIGTPTLSGGGVLAVPTYDRDSATANLVYLIDADNSHVLGGIKTGTPVFAQPVFADSFLLVAASGGRLLAYAP